MEHQNHPQTPKTFLNHKPFEVSPALYVEITPPSMREDNKVFSSNY